MLAEPLGQRAIQPPIKKKKKKLYVERGLKSTSLEKGRFMCFRNLRKYQKLAVSQRLLWPGGGPLDVVDLLALLFDGLFITQTAK